MNQLSARLLATLMVSSMLAAGHARADFMNWSYSTSAVPPGFSVNAPGNNGGGAVQLTPYTNVAGASSINALAYQTTATVPVTFNAASSIYTLTMTIQDNTTGHTGQLTFTGSIGGGLSPTSSTLVNTFANPTESLTLDGHKFTVTLPSSMPLAAPSSNQQNIGATVSVTDAGGGNGGGNGGGGNGGGGGGVHGAPEPASLVLGGLGFSLLGAGGWWKRRRPERQTA
jgi:hypothetical protein